MKVSIWQQFSSNHSSTFEVVGVFERVEDAQNAHFLLANLMADVVQWYETNEWTGKPSQPELDIAQQHKIKWEYPIDFVHGESTSSAKSAVRIYRHMVQVTHINETWMSKQPFEDLLNKLGANTAAWDVDSYSAQTATIFSMTIEATAPDSETVERLRNDWQTRLALTDATIEHQESKIAIFYSYFDIDKFRQIMTSLDKSKCQNITYKLDKINL